MSGEGERTKLVALHMSRRKQRARPPALTSDKTDFEAGPAAHRPCYTSGA